MTKERFLRAAADLKIPNYYLILREVERVEEKMRGCTDMKAALTDFGGISIELVAGLEKVPHPEPDKVNEAFSALEDWMAELLIGECGCRAR